VRYLRATKYCLIAAALLAPCEGFADSDSDDCGKLINAGAQGAQQQISADQAAITPPASVTTLTCLDNFFNGTGLNLISSLLDPATLLSSVEGRICDLVRSEWTSVVGSLHCGLTVTGVNIGFGLGSLGAGSLCPRISFGGGGAPIASFSTGVGGMGVGGSAMAPTGYTVPSTSGLW
jgi:hypothetical protein